MLVEASKRVLRISMLVHVACFQSSKMLGQNFSYIAYVLVGAKAYYGLSEFHDQKAIHNTHTISFAQSRNPRIIRLQSRL